MPFTVSDFHDLVQLLEQHPDWRADVRRLVLTDEVLALPQLLRELVAAQGGTDARVGELAAAQARTEARVEELVAAQGRTEARVGELAAAQTRTEARVEQLVAAQGRTEARIEELVAAQTRTEARVEELAAAQARTEDQLLALIEAQGRTERRQDRMERELQRIRDDLGELKGNDLERAHRENPYAYFGQLVRRAHLLAREELRDLLDEAVARGQLGPEEAADALLVDAVVRGRRESDGADVYLVVEVSWSVGSADVERASRRAVLLARAGLPTWPVAAGNELTPTARQRAAAAHVSLVRRGQLVGQPPENGRSTPA